MLSMFSVKLSLMLYHKKMHERFQRISKKCEEPEEEQDLLLSPLLFLL